MTDQLFVNDVRAAEILGLSPQTLRNWRSQSRGPDYVRIGRAVRYRVGDLIEFAEKRRIRHESEVAGK